jgi:hypothetical protein
MNKETRIKRRTNAPSIKQALLHGEAKSTNSVAAEPKKKVSNISYADKLKHPKWQRKRLEIMSRDNFTCRCCKDTETTLHVHHVYYESNKDPWDSLNIDLVTLCEDCHKEWHRIYDNAFSDSISMIVDLYNSIEGEAISNSWNKIKKKRMAKRFIDTNIFDDKWFMLLKKDSKLFWIYLITNCNHAGIIEFNEPLIKFKTGLNSLETVIKELDNRLIMLENDYYFIPKFLEYQYNNFPNSNVRSQISAINILRKFKLWDEEKQTVIKGLVNPCEYEPEHVHETIKNITPEKFYENELLKSNNDEKYDKFIKFLFGNNSLKMKLSGILGIKKQLTFEQFTSLLEKCSTNNIKLGEIITGIENKHKYYKDSVTVYRTALTWINNQNNK